VGLFILFDGKVFLYRKEERGKTIMITLSQVIAEVESSSNPFAVRFESEMYKNLSERILRNHEIMIILSRIRNYNKCDMDTAGMIFCTSWGLYQIMGENIYSDNIRYYRDIFSFLIDKDEQDIAFQRFTIQNEIYYPDVSEMIGNDTELTKFAKCYNGPGEIENYKQAIMDAYDNLTKKETV
jgi:hypothetical protein